MNYSKLFHCNIHKSIRISPMALKIIDTPEFQRMKRIKQLGLCDYVYHTATHTRYEHSIGVYHLADITVNQIVKQYPERIFYFLELGEYTIITPLIAECIKIAALCHDIGHGPFSHVFDGIFLGDTKNPNKNHEIRSCLIVEKICKRVLKDELNDKYINFIKSLIDPKKEHTGAIYQIVANNLNGIDVDKFDYLVRDPKNLGFMNGFDPTRLINELTINENNNIVYPKHCSLDILEMFHTRYMMHKKAYSHKTVILIEAMYRDIFIKIDKVFKISESINDMDLFCRLTDDTIINYIHLLHMPSNLICFSMDNETKQNLLDAYHIYQRIIKRDLYRQIIQMKDDHTSCFENFIDYCIEIYPNLNKNDFGIIKRTIGFVGLDKPDPFESIYFYEKKEDPKYFTLTRDYISKLGNTNISETDYHFFCKKSEWIERLADEFIQFHSKCTN